MIATLFLIITISYTAVQTIQCNDQALSINQGTEFTTVRVSGYEITDEVGAPQLPVKTVRIAVPKGARYKGISIMSMESKELSGRYLISCAQPPVILSQKEVKEIVRPRDEIYLSDAPYPQDIIEYKGSGVYDNQQIFEFLFYPVQYLPLSRKIKFHSHVTFTISYDGGMSMPAKSDRIRNIVLNPEDITVTRDDAYFNYMIITNTVMDTIFERLGEWKTKKGVKTEIRTTNWITANYPGEDNAAKIRNYIKTLADSGVAYVLLGGDTDVIPCRYAYAMSCSAFIWDREDSLPCDLYYADFEGDWNFDGDGLYGEIEDSIDLYPDVSIGRAMVNTIAEAQNFVEKIITYERNPSLDYLDNAMFSADILWTDPLTDQKIHKNKIDDESFPPYFDITKLYHSEGTLSVSSFLNAIGQGQNLINHDGHGSTTAMGAGTGYLHPNDFDNLTNAPKYGTIISIGCWTLAFDFNAIGEHYVNSPNGGGVAFIGNSSYGWGSPGNPGFGYSDFFDSRFFYSLLNQNNFHLGDALGLCKVHFIPYSREKNVYRWHQYQLNLCGDPEMPVWTAVPESLTVSSPQTIPLGSSHMLITVTDKNTNAPIPDALVCLMKDDESYAAGYTGVNGTVYLDVEPSTAGNFDLTVTAHNYIPVETTIPVMSGPYVNYKGWIINDSSGNSDSIANPDEHILLTIGIKNCGNATATNIQMKLRSQDPLVTIQDSTEFYASLAAGDSVTMNDAFEITIGSAVNGHGINFDLEIIDDAQTLDFYPIMLIGTPVIGIDEVIVAVPPSMPSDIESLYVNLENTGYGCGHATFATLHSSDPNVTVTVDSVWYGEIEPESIKTASVPFIVSIDAGCPASYLAHLPLTINTNDYSFAVTVDLLIGETGFQDNMESGDGLWTTGGTNNLWHISTRRAFSPTHAWYCGDSISGQYERNMNCYIQTVPFMINSNSSLSFYRWFSVPLYGADGIYVIITGDAFADTLDWIGTGGALKPSDTRGIQSDWLVQQYSLGEYPAGETIQVRIAFRSDGDWDLGEGFYIDDINIEGITMIEELTPDGITVPFFEVYPNPSHNSINIVYSIAYNTENSALKIYDITGRIVRDFSINQSMNQIVWDGNDINGRKLPAGVYFVQLITDQKNSCITRKAILLK
jgi:hypothetical protein